MDPPDCWAIASMICFFEKVSPRDDFQSSDMMTHFKSASGGPPS